MNPWDPRSGGFHWFSLLLSLSLSQWRSGCDREWMEGLCLSALRLAQIHRYYYYYFPLHDVCRLFVSIVWINLLFPLLLSLSFPLSGSC